MITYLLLNIVFLAIIICLLSLVDRHILKMTKHQYLVILILYVLTAIFDSLIIGLGIVSYDTGLISNVYVGLAPIEDFFYPLAAAIIVPALWRLGSHTEKDDNARNN